jgi:imidazole glycerol-phosphate synthase subunit HisH
VGGTGRLDSVIAPTVVVLDYGSGNLRSAERALRRVGAEVRVTADPAAAREADGLVVPGVGAFAACMEGIRAVGGESIVESRLAKGRPVLGICVGMQAMFGSGLEHGVRTAGLGVWTGLVERLDAPILPHIGWDTVQAAQGSELLRGVEAERFYFVHSYAARLWVPDRGGDRDPARVSLGVHGEPFVAAVEDGPLSATQFHPEKSGDAGAELLANWIEVLR